jgi:hypothetical protein
LPEISIKYDAPPTLSKFLDSNAFVRCCIGPVGSGKSSVCVMEILRRAVEQAPGPDGKRRTRFAVIRNTYRELRDTTRKTFEQWIPDALGTWHEQDFTFSMRFKDVECEVLFRSLDRPEDIKKLLSLELTGAYINEAREVPKQVVDMLSSRVGRYPSAAQGGATWSGIWMDTNPWHAGHWGARFFETTPPEHARAFRQPSGRAVNAENVEHLPAGYYDRLCIGKDSEWVAVYVDGHDAQAAQGSVYGALVSMLKQRGSVYDFPHDNDGVFTAWDLGIADMLDIWWFRFNDQIGRDGRRGVDLIDWYEAHNQPLSHYIEVIRSKPYRYERHFLPHDARARSLQTGISTIEQVQKELDHVAIAPELTVDQGIEAARWLLEQPTTRFHSRCDLVPQNAEYSGLGLLAEYRYEWDEVLKVFSKRPLHNFASHAADGFRYVACAVRQSDMLTTPPIEEPEKPVVKDLRTISIRAYLGDKWDPTRPTATRTD